MKRRAFFYTTLILIAGFLGFFTISVYITHTNNLRLAKDAVMETAKICANLYDDKADLHKYVMSGGDTRITVISPDGLVLADSRPLDFDSLENHLGRPEILAAAQGAPEAFIRHSDTLGVDLIYYALKAGDADDFVYIRVALPVARIEAYLYRSLPPLLLLLLAVALLCFLLARWMIKRIALPFASVESKLRKLAEGAYEPGPVAGGYEEIDDITRDIDEVAQILQDSFSAMRDEKYKAEYILNNIGDGLIVIDETGSIVLANASALAMFGAGRDMVGKSLPYLSYDRTLCGAVDDCIGQGKSALFELVVAGRTHFVSVSRLPETPLTVVTLSDVTESLENARQREEFFANASHELKTPLTAIKGFNELTAFHNKDDDIRKYIDGITRETERMLSLIGDMLKLSELENTKEINPAPVPLAKMAGEALDVLSAAIGEKAVACDIAGDATVMGEPAHVYELVKNLLENAVRYNHQGGKVSVIVKNEAGYVWLTVADDGIGIAPEEQARVFERFYRVEKSRSQRNGGTGLGLSIVKHICTLYNWKLSMKSKPGTGTEVTVRFG